MRKKHFFISLMLMVCTISTYAQEEEEGRYIEVTGSSKTEIAPDEIHVIIQIKKCDEKLHK